MSKFRIEKPFESRPPSLKDLVDKHIMGLVWVRHQPYEPVTDSLVVAERFNIRHNHVLRAIDRCKEELVQPKFGLNSNLIENKYLATNNRKVRKVDITEFGLMLLLLYINSPKARLISAEILYRFVVLKSYLDGLTINQINALKGYYRKQLKE